MGRPAKPAKLHVIHGTDRAHVRRRQKGKLSPPAESIGGCPEWMSPEGRAEWDRLTSHEIYRQILAPTHRGAVVEYCHLYGLMERGAKRLVIGEDIDGRPVYERLSASEGQRLNSLRQHLGLTPASQTKIQGPTEQKPDDPWSAF